MKRYLLLFLTMFIVGNIYSQSASYNYTVSPATTIEQNTQATYDVDINISDNYPLGDINVLVDIDYDLRGSDLNISLISPDGTIVDLSSGNGSGADFDNTIFDDEATTAIVDGTSPFNSSYQPEGKLDEFYSKNVNGKWILRVEQTHIAVHSGTINTVTLYIDVLTNVPGFEGPGGVGTIDGSSELAMWFDVNDIPTTITEVSSWTDKSGNENDASEVSSTNNPQYISNGMNGMPLVRFTNNNNDCLIVEDAPSLNPTTISLFVVGKFSKNEQWLALITKNNKWANGTCGYGISTASNDNSQYAFVSDYIYATGHYNIGTNTIFSMIYNKNNVELFNSGESIDTKDYTDNIISAAGYPLYLGACLDDNGGVKWDKTLDGDIAEVILIGKALYKTQSIIINNYLAAKYGLPLLGAIDYYTQDDSANGNFDFNVAGIGKETSVIHDVHDDSKGTGIIRINNASNLSVGDYLFWGENTKNASYSFSASVASGFIDRIDTKWRVSKTNDLGNVSISIATSDINVSGKQSYLPLNLIVSSNSDFITHTTYELTLNTAGDTYTATGVSFNDGDYFTIEFIDKIVNNENVWYNGSGANNEPSVSDTCFMLLVKNGSTANLVDSAKVRKVEIESGATLNLHLGIKLASKGNFNNKGDFSLNGKLSVEDSLINTGTISLDGELTANGKLISSGDISLTGKLTSNGSLINSGDISLIGNLTTNDSLINSGTISLEGTLTTNGPILNSSNITLLSKSINDGGTGSLITNGSIIKKGGTYEIQRYVTTTKDNGKWQVISSPIDNAETQLFYGQYFNIYDEGQGSFSSNVPTDYQLIIGEGYVVKWDDYFDSNSWSNPIKYQGSPNTGDQNIDLWKSVWSGTVNGIDYANTYFLLPEGFNLVGNPYPTNLDWGVVYQQNFTADNINSACYTYNDTGNSGSWDSFLATDPVEDRIISLGQGFGVVLSTNVEGKNLLIPKCARTHVEGTYFSKKSSTHNNSFNFIASSNGISDKVNFRVNDNATIYFDGRYDAYKFNSFGNTPTPYFISADGRRLSICSQPLTETVNLGFNMAVSGNVTFSLSDIQDFNEIILEDRQENTFTDLTKTDYTFSYDSEDAEGGRFVLNFNYEALSEVEELIGINIYANQGDITISSVEELQNVKISIYNITGKLVYSNYFEKITNKVINTNLKGVNIIKLTSDKREITSKIILK